MAELPSEECLADYDSSLLQLSVSDNEQTWLHCLNESDPNSIVDLSYILHWNQALNDVCVPVPTEDNTRGDHVNTTYSMPKEQPTPENKRTKLTHLYRKRSSCSEDLSSYENNSTLMNTLPIQSAQLNLNNKNEDLSRVDEHGIAMVAQLTIDGSPKINAIKSMKINQDPTLLNSSNSWNISDRTLIYNVSAPKGFVDSTLISDTPPSDFLHFSKLNFNPNSVSTPTKKLICLNTDEVPITSKNINDTFINSNIPEDGANDTYCVSLNNEENNSVNFYVTTAISTSNAEMVKTVDVVEELEAKVTLQNTFVLEDSIAEKNSSTVNTNVIINDKNLISAENIVNNKLDESQNLPYDSEADLNSTITLKPKEDDDSEEDSCYSSSSNIRSLGDVCDMSQLQPRKNSNVDCTLTKTRSEESLCLPEHACSSRKPKQYYGSALSLGTHNINQLTADRRLHQNPNYFLRKSEIQVARSNVTLPVNNAQHVGLEKASVPTRLSKIPRLQSKIPKLILKK